MNDQQQPGAGGIRLRFLGSLAAISASGDLTAALSQPKRTALVAWLALNRPYGLHRRDTLCALLWPESTDEKARASLRQLMQVLRRELGEHAFISEGDLVGLNAGVVTSDAGAVLDALEGGSDALAVDLYTGELVPGLHLSESEGVARWIEEQRSELRRAVSQAAWRLVVRAERDHDPSEALRWAERALGIDSENEAGLRRLIILLSRAGDRAAALRRYDMFARRLKDDWGTDPEPATLALVERIRTGDLGNDDGTGVAPAEPPVMALAKVATAASVADRVAGSGLAVREGGTRIRWPRVMSGFVLACVVTVVVGSRLRAARPRFVPNRVLVAPFANHTGDSRLDAMGMVAADWVIQALQRSGIAEVVDPATAYLATRQVADHPAESTARLRDAARGARAGLVVIGAIAMMGDSAEYSARLVDTRSARVLRVIDPIRAPKDNPTLGLDELRSRLAGAIASEIGSPLLPMTRGERPPRLEAYQAFMAGLEPFATLRYADAIRHFQRAIALDSSFTLAAIWMTYALIEVDLLDSSRAMTDRVRRGPDREVPVVKTWLEIDSLERAGASPDERVLAYRRGARLAPGSQVEWNMIFALMEAGRPLETIAVMKRLGEQNSWFLRWADYWLFLGRALHQAGDFRGELAAMLAARPFQPYPETDLRWRLSGLAAQGKITALRASLDSLLLRPGTPPVEILFAVPVTAMELEAHGHLSDAIRLLEWGEPLLRRRIEIDSSTTAWVDAALTLALLASFKGDRALAAEARQALEPGLLLPQSAAEGDMGAFYLIAVCAEQDSSRTSRLPAPIPAAFERPFMAALILVCQGDHEGAIRALAAQPPPWYAHYVPVLRPLRSDPRFQQWLRPRG